MQGLPSDRNSTSLAPPTTAAPATRLFSSSFRFLKQGEHTYMVPPPLAKLSISSRSGANPSSRMSSAKPFCERRTASTLRNTSVSLPEPSAALATTNATVALSALSLACVRLTQNLLAMGLALPSSDQVHGMRARHQRVAGHPTPRGQIGGRAAVERDELHDLPRLHAGQSRPELEDELTAAELAGVPGLIRLDVCAHDGV